MSAANTSSDTKAAGAAAAAGAGAGAGAVAAGTYQRSYLPQCGEPLQVLTAPIPSASKPGSAVIKVLAADVFPNAKEIYGGRLPYKPPAPMTPGGSLYGVVVAVADDVVGGPRAGAYVVANRLLKQNEAQFLLGLFTMTAPEHAAAGKQQVDTWKEGTWGQYCVLPAKVLVAIPAPIVAATPAHVLLRTITLSIAYGALITRGRFEAGQTVLVGGATGPHGLATVLLALAVGADTVYVMGRSADKLKSLTAISPRVKAIATGDGSDAKALAAAMAPAANAVDCFVDFYPFLPSAALTLAGINALKYGGVCVIGGGVQATLALPYMQFLLRNITVTGSFMYTDDTIARVLKLLGSGAIDHRPYQETQYFGVDKFAPAIEAANAQRDDAFRSHVVYPHGKL